MGSPIQEALDAHFEAHKEGIFREEVRELEKKLEEMEAMFGPMPHLRKELAELANDPKQYLNKHQNA